MKQIFTVILVLQAGWSIAQQPAETAYMQEIDAKMGSTAIVRKAFHVTEQERFTAYYFDGSLVCIASEEQGELANHIATHYYIRNDSLLAIQTVKCLTSSEILDLEYYSEAHRDSLGNVDLSQLPTNCMTVCVFYESGKLTRAIEGYDVFDELKSSAELQVAGRAQFTTLKRQLTATAD